MAFHYRLETLLRLQRSVEHQEENRLLACVAQVASLRAELRVWEQWRWERKRAAWNEHEEGAPGILLRIAAETEEALRRREKQIAEQLKSAEAKRDKQMQACRQARQKRETLDGLKEQQESAYNTEQLREIQKSLDEAHLLRSFQGDEKL